MQLQLIHVASIVIAELRGAATSDACREGDELYGHGGFGPREGLAHVPQGARPPE